VTLLNRFLSIALVATVVGTIWSYWLLSSETYFTNGWQIFVGLAAPALAVCAGILVISVVGLDSIQGRILGLIVGGTMLWAVGELFGGFNLFSLLAYPLVLMGFCQQIRYLKNVRSTATGFFITTVVLTAIIGWAVIYLIFVPNVIFWGGVTSTVIIILELMCVTIICAVRGGKLFYPWLALGLGFGLIFSAGIESICLNGAVLVGVKVLGYLLIGYGFNQFVVLIYAAQNSVKLAGKYKAKLKSLK
jgi:hypothetical protein